VQNPSLAERLGTRFPPPVPQRVRVCRVQRWTAGCFCPLACFSFDPSPPLLKEGEKETKPRQWGSAAAFLLLLLLWSRPQLCDTAPVFASRVRLWTEAVPWAYHPATDGRMVRKRGGRDGTRAVAAAVV